MPVACKIGQVRRIEDQDAARLQHACQRVEQQTRRVRNVLDDAHAQDRVISGVRGGSQIKSSPGKLLHGHAGGALRVDDGGKSGAVLII